MRLATVLAQMSEAFDDAEFPDHLGLKAAGLIDRWIEDPRVLREATDLYDKRWHWSDVPSQHLLEGSLGASYLDSVLSYGDDKRSVIRRACPLTRRLST